MDEKMLKNYYSKIDVPMYLLEDTKNLDKYERISPKKKIPALSPVFVAFGMLFVVGFLFQIVRALPFLHDDEGIVEIVVFDKDASRTGYIEGWYTEEIENKLNIKLTYSTDYVEGYDTSFFEEGSEVHGDDKDVVIEKINGWFNENFDLDNATYIYRMCGAEITNKMLEKEGKNIKQLLEDGYLKELRNDDEELVGFVSYDSRYYYGNVYYIPKASKHKKEALRYLDYMASAEGGMTYYYGPKGVGWDVDEDGRYYLTKEGKACRMGESNDIGACGNYIRGNCAINNTIWDLGMFIPYSKYNQTFDSLLFDNPPEKPDGMLTINEMKENGINMVYSAEIFYAGIDYEATVYYYNELPASKEIGGIVHNDSFGNTPREDFHSTHVPVGTKVYMGNGDSKYLYVEGSKGIYVLFVPKGKNRMTDDKLYSEKGNIENRKEVYVYEDYEYMHMLSSDCHSINLELDFEKETLSITNSLFYEYTLREEGDVIDVSIETKGNRLYITDKYEPENVYVLERVGEDYLFILNESASLDNFCLGWGEVYKEDILFKLVYQYE